MPTKLTTTATGFPLHADYFKTEGTSRDTLLFCLPGGGASKEFFNLAPGFNFTDRMSAQGFDIVTMDHPGTGTNPLPDGHAFLTPRQSADYLNVALQDLISLSELSGKTVIGVGHSMGGMIITLIQGRHKPFQSIALLGSSAGGLEWGLDDHEKTYIDRPEALEKDLESLTLRKFKTPFPKGIGGPSGKSITFGGETDALTQRLREISLELFAAGGMMSMTRGSFRTEVKAINVPIFFAFGDHDIGIPPEDAPRDYINAPSHELVILDNTGHNSFAFSSLTALCEQFGDWLQKLSISK